MSAPAAGLAMNLRGGRDERMKREDRRIRAKMLCLRCTDD